ncbi:MAG: formylglycine-generating enzyme family protein [Deltaproteobacteria bacterium]|jgi:formylglycine-generating enzyme required for sulfatase activity|nr:formylglycine-generating enzyme family protein [Deltaproteobacteria bacterium]
MRRSFSIPVFFFFFVFFVFGAFSGAGPAKAREKTLPPEIMTGMGLRFALVPAGSFVMGAGPDFVGDASYERPAREVRITKSFYVSETEVTQAQWVKVMGNNPSRHKGDDLPVDGVSHDDALSFLRKLNEMEPGGGFKLPTEAQWEYAARAGSGGNYCHGNDPDKLSEYAWYGEDLRTGSSHPVGTKKPNAWGLRDMHGNLFEWVADFMDENWYSRSPAKDPKGPETGDFRVIRGGSYASDAQGLQSAARNLELPSTRSMTVGLRIIKEAP